MKNELLILCLCFTKLYYYNILIPADKGGLEYSWRFATGANKKRYSTREMKMNKYFIGFPKTILETFICFFYIPFSFVSILGVLGIARIVISIFIPEMRLDLNNGWTFVLIFCATYFFNETVFNYLRFPFFLFTQGKIFGISICMGIPIPFSVLLDNINSVEEIYFPMSPYFIWVVKLKKQKWHQLWMKKRFYVSPFIKEHEKLVTLIKQGL